MEEDLEDFAAMMDDYFTRFIHVKTRNHYFSLHLYDLVDILNMRPSMSVWKECIHGEFGDEVESKLFSMLIDYALCKVMNKYSVGLNLFLFRVEQLLFKEYKLTASSKIDSLIFEMREYIQELETRLGEITNNVLDGLEPFPVLACGKNANEYFMMHDTGLYHIEKLCTTFKNGKCSAILCLFVLKKRQHYED